MLLVFAFRQNAPGVISRLIRFVTKSQDGISHVEMMFPDGRSFSSREPKGAAWADIVYRQNEWLLLTVDVSAEDVAKAKDWCDSMVGTPYDWLGILWFYLVKRWWSRWLFCSECAGTVAQILGLIDADVEPALTSPQRLYDLLRYRVRK